MGTAWIWELLTAMIVSLALDDWSGRAQMGNRRGIASRTLDPYFGRCEQRFYATEFCQSLVAPTGLWL